MTAGVPVLMYHALEDSDHPAGAKELGEQLYVLKVAQFREQMTYLHREGYSTYLLDELAVMAEWPSKAVVLTFDDGHESNHTLALPILEEFGFKAHFFITTGWIGTEYYLSNEQIKGLLAAGMGVGSHGVTHRFLTDLPVVEAENELRESMQTLASVTGCRINSFSAPGGRISSDVVSSAVRHGYDIVCTSKPAFASQTDYVPRIALSQSVDMKLFAKIVSRDVYCVGKMHFKDSMLAMAKMLLGNDTYIALRSILLERDAK